MAAVLGCVPSALREGQEDEQGCMETGQAQNMWPSKQEPDSTDQENSLKNFNYMAFNTSVKIYPCLSFPFEVGRVSKKWFSLDL